MLSASRRCSVEQTRCIVQNLSESRLISIRKGEGIAITEIGDAYLKRPTRPIVGIEIAFPPNEIILLDIDRNTCLDSLIDRNGGVKSYQLSHENYEVWNYGSAGIIATTKNSTRADWARRLA